MSCSEFTERKKNEALVASHSLYLKHSLFGAIDASVRMPRGYNIRIRIRIKDKCYSATVLDGGVIVETQNIQIDGGTSENNRQLCSINGGEI